MHRMRKVAISALLAPVLAGTVTVLVPSPVLAAASSSSIVYTNGTRAGEAFFNRSVSGSHGNRAWFDVYDAKCDASSVYVEYILNGAPKVQKENVGGCGTTKGYNLQTGRFAIQYRACVNDSFGQHPCGIWVSDNNY
jgi:hypothetical protein